MIDVSGTILFWCKSPVFKKQFNEVVMEKKKGPGRNCILTLILSGNCLLVSIVMPQKIQDFNPNVFLLSVFTAAAFHMSFLRVGY